MSGKIVVYFAGDVAVGVEFVASVMENAGVKFEADDGEEDDGEESEETDLHERNHRPEDRTHDDLRAKERIFIRKKRFISLLFI